LGLITIECEGYTETHIESRGGNYVTICGLDGHSDSTVEQKILKASKVKVDCAACVDIWNDCNRVKPKQIMN